MPGMIRLGRSKSAVARRTTIMGWSMSIIAAVLIFAPGLPEWSPLLACLVPCLLLVMIATGKYPLIAGKKGDGGLQQAVITVPLLISIYALVRYDLVDWQRALVGAIIVGIAFSAALWWASRSTTSVVVREKYLAKWTWLFFAVIGTSLGWGALVMIDCATDRAEAAPLASKVVSKYVSSGRNTSYHLEITGPFEAIGGHDVRVSRRFYDTQAIGATVCVWVHPGTLGLRWYDVGRC
jgi:hypothetical protein